MKTRPENTLLRKSSSGEHIFLPSANVGSSITINIGLNPPAFASYVSQELKVYVIMVLLIYVAI